MAPEACVNYGHGPNAQDESQDSQLVTLYMHRLHGERSSSPVQPPDCVEIQHLRCSRFNDRQPQTMPRARLATAKNPAIAATVPAKDEIAPADPANLNRPSSKARATNASNNLHRAVTSSQRSTRPPTPSQQVTATRVGCQALSKAGGRTGTYGLLHTSLKLDHNHDYEGDDGNNDLHYDAAAAAAAAASRPFIASAPKLKFKKQRRVKMDLSQSPTQSNDGRSYEQYLPRGDDLIPSGGYELERLQGSQQSAATSANEGTAHDDDTGAVDFDFSAMGRRDTQFSYPDPDGSDRLQQTSPNAFIGLPETPAPSRNPFADSKSSLMAASQMFQTSSAHKIFSPTSSRPSPDNIRTLHSLPPHPVTSSPLKKATTISSPFLAQFPEIFGTSPQQAVGDDFSDNESQENQPPSAAHGSEAGSDPSSVHKSRRRRQRGLRESTERRLRPIALPRPSTSDEIVPSTNRATMLGPATGHPGRFDENLDKDSQDAIEDTQIGAENSEPDDLQSTNDLVEKSGPRETVDPHISSNEATVPNTASSPPASAPLAASVPLNRSPTSERPQILESNSMHAQPRAIGDMLPTSSQAASKAESFTNLLGSSLPIDAKKGPQSKEVMPERPSGLDSGVASTPLQSQTAIAETSPPVDSSPPPPAFSTRARLRDVQSRSSTNPPTSSPPPASSTSSLSKLGATPTLSGKTTPATNESPQRRLVSSSTEELDGFPAVANRRKDWDVDVKPRTNRSKTRKALNLRSRRSLDIDESTDELARSPSVSIPPVYQQSARMSRYGRASLKETPTARESGRGAILFAGMAFAISFQAKQVGERDSHYNSRIAASSQIANKIQQGGGKVLSNGFDQLFEVTPVKTADRESNSFASTPQPDEEISLAPSALDTGFTALIADGHSRKVKYMQALALGLPCIHERWVSTCVEKQKLVDWSDYLLCAGNSAFLGNAIRSRSLSPYDAATAKLSQTIQHRPRLLKQSRILLIMSRAEEQKKMAYVFLARVLGASLSRVYTVDEARKQLKAREDAGHPYDWVYLEEKMADSSGIFSNSLSVVSASTSTVRKRKRRNEASLAGPPPKKIRTLSDELVIQSLILGRLMDEEEMAA